MVYWLPIGGPAAQAGWLGPKVGGLLAQCLYSLHEPSELSQWLCYDDSTINIVVVNIIIRLCRFELDLDEMFSPMRSNPVKFVLCINTSTGVF